MVSNNTVKLLLNTGPQINAGSLIKKINARVWTLEARVLINGPLRGEGRGKFPRAPLYSVH